MKEKLTRFVCLALALGGFVIMVGTAGASDCRDIDYIGMIVQMTIGLICTISGVVIGVAKGV